LLSIVLFIFTLFFLIGSFFLTACVSAFRGLSKKDAQKEISNLGKVFFYNPFHKYFFSEQEDESLFFATICAQNLARFGFVACSISLLLMSYFPLYINSVPFFWFILNLLGLFLTFFIIADYLPRLFGLRLPEKALSTALPITSIFLFLAFPLTYIVLKTSQSLFKDFYFDSVFEPSAQAKQELIELIQETEVSPTLDSHDKKIIESVLTYKERTAKEVMVPRVDMFSLSADTTIKDAALLIQKEGYSRTPVYRNTVDNIVGVLMYKDVLNKYMEFEDTGDHKILEAPIESIQKNILYTPETRKISNLLQEFRKKKVHFAIVVDEYGGTEGIITIEDILEEIVGEIADEYDQEEESFKQMYDGSWIVDAKENIWDVEEHLGIQIPQEEDYDTLGGYVFHVAGEIPSSGFIIHHENFELEVLESNERSVEKVRIKPLNDS
jgi:CBS domain containing-hemolysin-like protein